jgi:hypothetical protein
MGQFSGLRNRLVGFATKDSSGPASRGTAGWKASHPRQRRERRGGLTPPPPKRAA